MSFSCISDVHIRASSEVEKKLFLHFLNDEKVKSSDQVFLLGDIFDLFVGPSQRYLTLYENIFEAIATLIKRGAEVYYFTGNHDFHIKNFFKNSKVEQLQEIIVVEDVMIKEIDGIKFYFSHGDELDLDDVTYHRYKKIITSKPLKFLANHIVPFKLIELMGNYSSKKSREVTSKRNTENEIRQKYRKIVEKIENVDVVICGHNHCKDYYQSTSNLYLNNGYFPRTKCFIYWDGKQISFNEL